MLPEMSGQHLIPGQSLRPEGQAQGWFVVSRRSSRYPLPTEKSWFCARGNSEVSLLGYACRALWAAKDQVGVNSPETLARLEKAEAEGDFPESR